MNFLSGRRILVIVTAMALGFACHLAGQPAAQDAAANTEQLQSLLKERLDILKKLQTIAADEYRSGLTSLDQFARAQIDVLNAELEMSQTKEDRIAVRENYLKITQDLEKSATRLHDEKQAGVALVLTAKANRLQAEIALQRERAAE